MLDFKLLKQSDFYKKGSYFIKYDPESYSLKLSKARYFNALTDMHGKNNISEIKQYGLANEKHLVLPSLYHLLKTSTLDENFRNLIFDQWLEVASVLDKFNLPHIASMVYIGEGKNAFSKNHKHAPYVKQTITFMYNFGVNSDLSYVGVEDKKYYFPKNNEKLILSMKDNPTHCASMEGGWSFIWINDFTNYIDIPESVYKIFTPIIQ